MDGPENYKTPELLSDLVLKVQYLSPIIVNYDP